MNTKPFSIAAALAAVGFLIARKHPPRLHERLMSRCEDMFEQMPDNFPPKRMMRSIDEIHVETSRILELLEPHKDEADELELADLFSTDAAR